jgi:hypothetical protein
MSLCGWAWQPVNARAAAIAIIPVRFQIFISNPFLDIAELDPDWRADFITERNSGQTRRTLMHCNEAGNFINKPRMSKALAISGLW